MTKQKLTLLFGVQILILISLMIYRGVEIEKETTETMAWYSARFRFKNTTKFLGITVFLSIIVYVLGLKRLHKTN